MKIAACENCFFLQLFSGKRGKADDGEKKSDMCRVRSQEAISFIPTDGIKIGFFFSAEFVVS